MTTSTVVSVFLAFGHQHPDGSDREAVGRLVSRERTIFFEYAPQFLLSGREISPFKLKTVDGVITLSASPFGGLAGVFNDSIPDGWGRLILDRALRQRGIAPASLTPLDRLLYVGRHGKGALEYEPENNFAESSALGGLNLSELAQGSARILAGDQQEVLAQLVALGGTSGGARPKVFVGVDAECRNVVAGVDSLSDGFEHWMVKFPSSGDPQDIGAIEHAYAQMAKAAGISMPSTHLFAGGSGPGFFGVQRFDRRGNQKLHLHSVSGLLHADYRVPALDYSDLLLTTRMLTRDQREVEKMFRLAVFNVLAHNRDDHGNNFSFLMERDGIWRLAPAYDLTFSFGPGGEQSTMVMGEGKNPTTQHLKALAKRCDVPQKVASEMIDAVAAAVARWMEFADLAGVTRESSELVKRALLGVR